MCGPMQSCAGCALVSGGCGRLCAGLGGLPYTSGCVGAPQFGAAALAGLARCYVNCSPPRCVDANCALAAVCLRRPVQAAGRQHGRHGPTDGAGLPAAKHGHLWPTPRRAQQQRDGRHADDAAGLRSSRRVSSSAHGSHRHRQQNHQDPGAAVQVRGRAAWAAARAARHRAQISSCVHDQAPCAALACCSAAATVLVQLKHSAGSSIPVLAVAMLALLWWCRRSFPVSAGALLACMVGRLCWHVSCSTC